MDFDQLYPNRFLKAGELGGKDVHLKISAVKVEVLEGEKGPRARGIISFERTQKQLVLNRTNGECIKVMFGRNTDAWIGKWVTFFAATIKDSFTKQMIPAIRVRGSPDIAEGITFSAKIGRKMETLKVSRTAMQGQRPAGQRETQRSTPPPQQQPPDEIPFGEPPPIDEAEAASILASETQQA